MNTLDIYSEKRPKEGMEKAAEQRSDEFVKNLLASTSFDIVKITGLADVSEPFVEKVQAALKKKK